MHPRSGDVGMGGRIPFGFEDLRKTAEVVLNPATPAQGYWVHVAKVAFEKYFLRKVRKGRSEPIYERFVMKNLGIPKLRRGASRSATAAAAD